MRPGKAVSEPEIVNLALSPFEVLKLNVPEQPSSEQTNSVLTSSTPVPPSV
jgi:hypothetical protein